MSIGFQQGMLTLPTGPVVSPQATAFLARTSGLSTTERNAYIAMINGMVTDGTWSLFDWFYIFATNNTTTALLNLISTNFTGTTHGTVSFSADHGFTGDGSTFYIDTGWKTTNGTNYVQNSAVFGVYDLTNSTTGDGSFIIGQDAGANYDVRLAILTVGNLLQADANDTVSNSLSIAAQSQRQGSFGVIRTGSAAEAVYKNGSLLTSGTAVSGALSAFNVFIFANNSGVAGAFSTDQLSAAFAGGGMTAVQLQQVQSRINGYMTALGINVY
jgi:hypothetical protein